MDGKAFDMPVGKASVEELGKHVKLSDRIEVQLKMKFQRDENLARIRTELRERNECKSGFKM